MKKFSNRIAMGLLVAAAAQPALAQDVGAMAKGIGDQATDVGKAIMIIIAVAGVVVALMGLLKFKAHSANPNDPSNKLSSAFMMIFVGAAMVALPEVLGTGISSLFGDRGGALTGGGVISIK